MPSAPRLQPDPDQAADGLGADLRISDERRRASLRRTTTSLFLCLEVDLEQGSQQPFELQPHLIGARSMRGSS